MSGETHTHSCDAWRDELVRLGCGEGATPPLVAEHLLTCAACHEWLEETVELAGSLRVALRPEPLSEDAEQRLLAEVARRPTAVQRPSLRLSHWVAAAVAASLVVAVLLDQVWRGADGKAERAISEAVALSPEDAAEIVRAYSRLQWSDPVSRSLEAVGVMLERIEQDVAGEVRTDSILPWEANDEWDAPVGEQRGATEVRPRGPRRFDPRNEERTHENRLCVATGRCVAARGEFGVRRATG